MMITQVLDQKLFTSVMVVAYFALNTNSAHSMTDDEQTREEDEHVGFDIVVAGFISFILCMIALHCYLKRKERQKIEVYMNLQ